MVTISKPIKTLLASLFVFVLFLFSMSCSPSGNTNSANGGGIAPTATPTPSPSPTPMDCTKADPNLIQKAIYNELATLNLGKELFNFNISIKTPPQINIIGWSTRKADVMAAIGKATSKCTIDDQYFYDDESKFDPPYERPGCPGGFMPCGDVCIPTTQHCAWAGMVEYKLTAGNTNTSSATVSNSNANSNMAINANSNSNTNTAKKP